MWQEINAEWLSCHWWQESQRRRIAAMLIFLLVLLVTATTIALVRTISSDGYGSRPAPRSHHHDAPHGHGVR